MKLILILILASLSFSASAGKPLYKNQAEIQEMQGWFLEALPAMVLTCKQTSGEKFPPDQLSQAVKTQIAQKVLTEKINHFAFYGAEDSDGLLNMATKDSYSSTNSKNQSISTVEINDLKFFYNNKNYIPSLFVATVMHFSTNNVTKLKTEVYFSAECTVK